MKIVYITEYFPYKSEEDITGGVEARCMSISKELSKKHDVTIITSWQKGQKRKHNIGKVKILRVGPDHAYSNSGSMLSRFKFASEAERIAKKIKADIIEGYSFVTYPAAYKAARKNGAKAIATYHEVWIGEWVKNKGLLTGIFGSIWERNTLKLKWDKLFPVSNFTANRLVKNNIPKSKIEVVYNGIDTDKYKKVKAAKSKRPTIISISRLTPHKRVIDLIKATYLLKKTIPNVRTIIVGQGEEEEKLKALSKKLNLENNVEFEGYVKEHKDVIKLLKSSHIFCLPSVLEGFGIVLAEAMASDVPYVCSDIPVLKEVTLDGKAGMIFKQKDYADLAKKIKRLILDKDLYNKKVKEAKQEVKKYDWKVIMNQLENSYADLLK